MNLALALFRNTASLSFLGLASANNLALTKATLIPRPQWSAKVMEAAAG
ncbi:hypothetical protein H7F51_07690 [Novosphingobium flavum]|uniref:Uncharacterized protein n=1 Tax=Novosphingobium flavum TaxID=1778672 RepID=A0A7X1KLB3_9SPHN|nr:hypothetical protein [Novosphingobium flavum]MBC2665399.1 hypothetical protein [Novosphingobium flavum]